MIKYIALILFLAVVYMACFSVSGKGYGYPGYRGFERRCSFFCRPDYLSMTYDRHHHRHRSYRRYSRVYDPSSSESNRETSVNGNRFSRRGTSGGK